MVDHKDEGHLRQALAQCPRVDRGVADAQTSGVVGKAVLEGEGVFMPLLKGKPPKSRFGSKSTAEEVTEGLDLSGKTAVITGINSGIGFETMRVLHMRGAHIIGAARTLDKAKDVCGQFGERTTPVACELSDLDSVVNCSEAVRLLGRPVDILICNAGVMGLPKLEQQMGVELQFFTNHIGHFVLVNRLLNSVDAAGSGRIVILSSTAHKGAPRSGIEFDNLSGERHYRPMKAYSQSKLANLLFAKELARRTAERSFTVNAVHPGVIPTNIGRTLNPFLRAAFGSAIVRPFTKNIEQGAATTCYVATNPALNGVSGHYFADCNQAFVSASGRNAKLANRLWDVSLEIAGEWLV